MFRLDLSAYSGLTVKVRFRLKKRGSYSAHDGWYIDDVTIEVPKDIDPPPKVAVSPPSGYYVGTQEFDLALLVEPTECSGLAISATFDGNDVSSLLNNCVIPGTLSIGGESLRCPGVNKVIYPGYHSFEVTFDFDNCGSRSKTVN